MEAEKRLARLLEKQRERGRRYRERKAAQGLRRTWAPAEGASWALEAITQTEISRVPIEQLRIPGMVMASQLPQKRKPVPKPPRELTEWEKAFEEVFWPDYRTLGRDCPKADALAAWNRVPHADQQEAIDRLWTTYQRAKAEWSKATDVVFIPHAATWLNRYARDRALDSGQLP